MKKIILAGILSTIILIGTLSNGSAADYNFEVNYNGTDFTLVSALDPLTQSITAGDTFTYTINTVGTDYFEVTNPNGTGWNPWLFIYISDTANGVIFDYQTELFLGTTPVLTIPFTGIDNSTEFQGNIKSLGVYHGASIPNGTTFDRLVMSAQIFPTTTTPFVFTDYMPRELAPGWQLAEYMTDGGPTSTSSVAISTGNNGTTVSGEPAGTYYKKVGIPSINDGKELAFYAQLVNGKEKTHAILSGVDPTVLVREGDAADGTTSTFKMFKDPLLNNSGDVAIIAQLKGGGVTKKNDYGIWSNGFGGGLQLVSREGDVAMDAGSAQIASFKSVALESGVTPIVAYHAKIKGKGIKSKNDEVLWSYDGTTTRLLLREGEDLMISGTTKTLKSFRVLGQFAKNERLVSGQGFGLANGVINALLSFTDKTTAIASIYTDGTAPDVVAMTDDPATEFGGGETFNTFMTPGQNSLGGSVFFVKVQPKSSLDSALYNVDGGAGGMLNRIAVLGDAATGTAGTFKSFGGAVNNGSDQVALIAGIQGAGINKKSDQGIWFFDSLDWVHLAQEGSEADMTGGAKWKSFKSLALQENGLPLFVGQLSANKKTVPKTTKKNDLGLWAFDVNGTLQLIVREGVTEVGGKKVKTFKVLDKVGYSPGQTRSHNGTGGIVYWAQFTDKTQGIVVVEMPVPII